LYYRSSHLSLAAIPERGRVYAGKAEDVVRTDATLTSKGQTTIPKQIRDSLGIKAGDRMTFTLMPDGLVLMRVKNKSVMTLAGSLHRKGRRTVPVKQLSR